MSSTMISRSCRGSFLMSIKRLRSASPSGHYQSAVTSVSAYSSAATPTPANMNRLCGSFSSSSSNSNSSSRIHSLIVNNSILYRSRKFSGSSSSSSSSSSSKHISADGRGIWRPDGYRMGWSYKVVSELLPHTSEILLLRSKSLESIAVGYFNKQGKNVVEAVDANREMSTDESWLEMILPFSDQPALRDSMVRADGRSILYGKLFEILDAFAADAAYRHCGVGKEKCTIVTACVDGVKAFENIDVFDDVKLQAYLTYAGTSSMEVTIDVITEKARTQVEAIVGRIQFIMVARDTSSDSGFKIPKLVPSTPAFESEFNLGKIRAQQRKSLAKDSLQIRSPKPDEIDVMHQLYLESRSLKSQKNQLIQLISKSIVGVGAVDTTNNNNGSGSGSSSSNSDLNVKKNFKWLKNTYFKSTQLMHAQDRNISGKVFGGHIIKTSFDLAWISASCFFGTENPIFYCVDDIQFVKPVTLGSIMEYSTAVIYSHRDSIMIQVDAYSVNCRTLERTKTNVLSYVFKHPPPPPSSAESSIINGTSSAVINYPQVIPKEYDEFVLYLDGKRAFERLMALNQV